jgi:hypothetical protein
MFVLSLLLFSSPPLLLLLLLLFFSPHRGDRLGAVLAHHSLGIMSEDLTMDSDISEVACQYTAPPMRRHVREPREFDTDSEVEVSRTASLRAPLLD